MINPIQIIDKPGRVVVLEILRALQVILSMQDAIKFVVKVGRRLVEALELLQDWVNG